MTWFLTLAALLVLCSVIFVFSRKGKTSKDTDIQALGSVFSVLSIVAFFLIGGIYTACSSFSQVPVGHIGLVYTFGAITGQTGDGLVARFPWQDLNSASIQVEKIQEKHIVANSKETQDVFVDATLNYSVNPDAVQRLYATVGPNYVDKLIPSRIINFIKEETVKYAVTEVTPSREAIRVAVRDRLQRELAPFSITVNDLLIDNIDFDQPFKDAILNKQKASQQALTEQQNVEVAKQQAQQKREQAAGDADVVRAQADGQADANRTIAASLSPQVLQYLAIQKLASDVKIALIPSSQGLILDPSSLLAPK